MWILGFLDRGREEELELPIASMCSCAWLMVINIIGVRIYSHLLCTGPKLKFKGCCTTNPRLREFKPFGRLRNINNFGQCMLCHGPQLEQGAFTRGTIDKIGARTTRSSAEANTGTHSITRLHTTIDSNRLSGEPCRCAEVAMMDVLCQLSSSLSFLSSYCNE